MAGRPDARKGLALGYALARPAAPLEPPRTWMRSPVVLAGSFDVAGDIEAVTDAPGHRVCLPCASVEAEACDEGATPAPTRQRAPRHSEDAISAQRVLLSPPPHDPRP